MKYSKDGKVLFNENDHSYFLGNKKLEGVTTFISRFKNKFDSDKMAEKYAIKHGLDKESVLKEWEKKGKDSLIQGKLIHSIFENYILNGEINNTQQYEKEQAALRFISEYFETGRLIPVECENVVYNENIASQIDCIVKDKNGNHYILDWKTNSKIETNSYGKYMLKQYCDIPDSSFYHYSLQLSIYKELYKEHEIKDCYIVHIKENDFEFIKYQPIKFIYNV